MDEFKKKVVNKVVAKVYISTTLLTDIFAI